MSPVHVLNVLLGLASKLLVDIQTTSPLVVCLHPQQGESADYQPSAGGSQIQTIADVIVW